MMSGLEITLLLILAWIDGIILGYIIWAPTTSYKQGLNDGLSLKFIWGRFVK
jgi:hypothetical protein